MFSEQAEAVRAVPAFINNKGKSMAPLVPKLTCICQKYKYIKFGEFWCMGKLNNCFIQTKIKHREKGIPKIL